MKRETASPYDHFPRRAAMDLAALAVAQSRFIAAWGELGAAVAEVWRFHINAGTAGGARR